MQRRAKRALERQLAYQHAKARSVADGLERLESELTDYAVSVRARIEKYRRIEHAARILEVGSGAHGVIFFLGIPTAIGVDPLADDYAQLFPEWQSRVKTVAAFGESLPFEDASFDVVISDNVVDHAEDPRKIVRELVRVLAPGGVLYFTVNVHHRFYDVASRIHGIAQRLGSRFEIPAFADHTVHMTLPAARRLFADLPIRVLEEVASIEDARRVPIRRVSDIVKRVFFKNARFEVIATRD